MDQRFGHQTGQHDQTNRKNDQDATFAFLSTHSLSGLEVGGGDCDAAIERALRRLLYKTEATTQLSSDATVASTGEPLSPREYYCLRGPSPMTAHSLPHQERKITPLGQTWPADRPPHSFFVRNNLALRQVSAEFILSCIGNLRVAHK